MATIAEQIATLQARLVKYIAAEQFLLVGGQAYSIGNRSLTMADLSEVRKAIIDLNNDISALQRGNTIPIQRVVPRDNI